MVSSTFGPRLFLVKALGVNDKAATTLGPKSISTLAYKITRLMSQQFQQSVSVFGGKDTVT